MAIEMEEIQMKLKETLTLVVVGLLVVSGFGMAVGTLEGTDVVDIGESNEDGNGFLTEGNTVEGDPIEIQDWYDLDAVRDDLYGNYILMNDLDEDTYGYDELVYTENGWQPIGADVEDSFTGTFDGNGHSIKGLYIDRADEDSVGLFGISDEGGEIKNIGVIDGNVTGDNRVGMLVGLNRFGGTVVSNSYVAGEVNGEERTGALVGINFGTVENSYAEGEVGGNYYVGGLVGSNRDSGTIVSNSYSTGGVHSDGFGNMGGLVGANVGGAEIEKCYSVGEVTGGDLRVGGLIGWNEDDTVEDSFWNIDTSGQDSSEGGTGLTEDEMLLDQDTFTDANWDFVDHWDMIEEDSYPFFQWQEEDTYPYAPELVEYELTLNIQGEGSVEIDPEQDGYEHGKELELTPEPKEEYVFDHWVINGEVYEEEKIEIEIYEDTEITAQFEEEDEILNPFMIAAIVIAVSIIGAIVAVMMKKGRIC